MIDNEIIKALECCVKGCNSEGCDDCPLYEEVEDCEIEIPIIALDLINRQKAEVERLEGYNANLEYDNQDVLCTLETEIEKAKSEAIREFALELISGIHKLEKHSCEIAYKVHKSVYLVDDVHNTIDSLVKERTEDKS